MKILHIAAEVAPFVTVGGLSQVMYFLPKAQVKLGLEVRVVTPKYGEMKEQVPGSVIDTQWLRVPLVDDEATPIRATEPVQDAENAEYLICNMRSCKIDSGVTAYLLENREYYELRANVFGYKDDHIRFALLCKGTLEWLLYKRSIAVQN
jgi:starch synthase